MSDMIGRSPMLRDVLESVGSGVFSPSEPQRFAELVDVVSHHDHFMVAGDFDAYASCQRQVATLWRDRSAWWRASALNTAHVGFFSSDRAIAEYAADIWNVPTGRSAIR